MKNLLRNSLFLLILSTFSISIFAQLQEIKFFVKHDNADNRVDVYLHIEKGEALTGNHRIQANGNITLVVPTGMILSIDSLYMPLHNNLTYDGTLPMDWDVQFLIAPMVQPDNDFYSFKPRISPVSRFNNLLEGDEVKLFSLKVENGCASSVRPYLYGFDPTSSELIQVGGGNYGNGYTIGSLIQLYNGNLPSVSLDIVNLGSDTICVGETTIMSPSTGVWVSNNVAVATIDLDAGLVTGTGAGYVTFNFTDNETGCTSTSEPVYVIGSSGLQEVYACGRDSFLLQWDFEEWLESSLTYSWSPAVGLSDTTVLSPWCYDTTGMEYTLYIEGGSCSIEQHFLVVSGAEIMTTLGDDKICIGQTTVLTPNTGGTWISDDASVATISSSGIATGVSEGIVHFVFISVDGCESEPSEQLTVVGIPQVSVMDSDITLGSVTQLLPYMDGTWTSSDVIIAYVDNLGIVTALNPGFVCFVFTSDEGCSSNEICITIRTCTAGPDKELDCVFLPGGDVVMDATGNGIWVQCPNNPGISTILNETDPNTHIVNFSEGGVYCYIWDGECRDTVQVTVTDDTDCTSPCDSITDDWIQVKVGRFSQYYNISDWVVGSGFGPDTNLDHIVFYDYSDGKVYLKENDGNGQFKLEEKLLLTNQYHYENGEYELYLEDINKDGLMDIIIGERAIPDEDSFNIIVYRQTADFDFVEELLIVLPGDQQLYNSSNTKFEDLDHNGSLDIINMSTEAMNVIFISTSESNWSDDIDVYELTIEDCDFYLTDIDRDGYKDILAYTSYIYDSSNKSFHKEVVNVGMEICNNKSILFDDDLEMAFYSSGVYSYDGNVYYQCFDLPSSRLLVFKANIYSSTNEDVVYSGSVTNSSYPIVLKAPLSCESEVKQWGNNDILYEKNKIDMNHDGYSDFLFGVVNSEEDIYVYINPAKTPKIVGIAYIDENENGVFDTGETVLDNVMVKITPGNMMKLTDDKGQYVFSVEAGTYTVTAMINEGEWESTELALEVEVDSYCNIDNNFGFVQMDTPPTMTLSMVHSNLRCDGTANFFLHFTNIGSEVFNGKLVFDFDQITSYNDAGPLPISIGSNQLIFDISNLNPFQKRTYIAVLQIPPGMIPAPMMTFSASIVDIAGEELASYSVTEEQRCSLDPNDKRTYPSRDGDVNLTLFSENLEYTIRFQNTGNDTAYIVRIEDPLDSNIDPTSVRVIGSSHDVETIIDENNKLIFVFDDINLLDSTSSYLESQGYVSFRCDQKEYRSEYTEVYNQVGIYFDKNEPVPTNRVRNTLVSQFCTLDSTVINVKFCPGGSYDGHTEEGTYIDNLTTTQGCDSISILHIEYLEVPVMSIDTTICWFGEVYGQSTTGSYDMVLPATEGCDTVLTLTLNVLDQENPDCITASENLLYPEIYLYPNPTDGVVYIHGIDKDVNVSIRSIDGRLYPSLLQSHADMITIHTEQLPTGIYIVKLFSKSDKQLMVYKKLSILR